MADPDSLVAAILQHKPGRLISRLLKSGHSPDAIISQRDQSGFSPCHHAIMAGSAEALQALLDHAARHTRPARTGDGIPCKAPGSPWALVTAAGPGPSYSTPLHLAAERNDALLRLILEHSSLGTGGASFFGFTLASRPHPELLQLRDGRGWTPLVYAARSNTPCLRLMLQYLAEAEDAENGGSGCGPSRNSSSSSNSSGAFVAGRSVNVADDYGLTPLHHAALLGKADNCRLLLKAGCNQAALCSAPERALPLHFAAAGNHVAALETLFRYAVAAQPGGFRVAQQVLLRPDGSGMPALHTAVLHGAVDGARRLLQLVFPFDTRGPAGRTALHLAALRGSTVMVSMLLRHSTPAQRELRDDEGLTAVHVAAAAGQLDSLRTLVAEGAVAVDVRASAGPAVAGMYEGSTPLHCAVRRGLVAAVEVLVRELGADPHARDARGRAPYDLAVALAAASASRRGSAHMSNHNSRGGGGGRGGAADADPGMLALEEVPLELADSEDGSGSSHSADHAAQAAAGAAAPMSAESAQRKSMLMGTADVALGLGLSSADEIDGGRLPEEKALAVLQAFLRLLHEPLLLRGGGDSASSLQGGGVSSSLSMGMSAAALSGGLNKLASPQTSSAAVPPPLAGGAAAAGTAGAAGTAAAAAAPVAAADAARRSAQAEAKAVAEAAAMAVALAGEGVVMMAPVPVEWGDRARDSRGSGSAAAVLERSPEVVVAAAEVAAEAAMSAEAGKGPAARTAAPSSNLLQVLSSTTIPASASTGGQRAAPVAQPSAPQPTPAQAQPAQPATPAAAASAASPPPGAKGSHSTPATTSDAGALAHVSDLASKPSPRGGSVGGAASRDPSIHRTSAASAASHTSHTGGGAAPVSGASDGAPSLALAFLATQLASPAPAPPPPAAAPAPTASVTRASPFGPAKAKGARPSPFQPKASPFQPKPSPFTPKPTAPPAQRTSRDTSAHGKDASAHGSRMSSPVEDGPLAAPAAVAVAVAGVAEGSTAAATAGAAAGSQLLNPPGVAAAPPQQASPDKAVSALVQAAPAAAAPAALPSPAAAPSPSEAAVLPSGSGSLPPSASCAVPPHAAPVCVISPINNPVGYSALNRAILTKRRALVDALLATLPSTGLSFGGGAAPEVVVLAPPVPSRRPMAAAYGTLPHPGAAQGGGGGVPPALGASRVTTCGQTAAGGREMSTDLAHRLPSGASHGPHGLVAHAPFLHQRTLDSAKSHSTASLAPAATTGAAVGSGSGVVSGADVAQGRMSHSGMGQVHSGGAGLHRHHAPSPLSLPPGAHAPLVHAATQPHLNAGQHGAHHTPAHHVILGDIGARYPPSPSTASFAGSGATSAAPHGTGHGHAGGSGALTSRQTSSPFAAIAGQPSGLSSSIPTAMLASLPAASLAPPPPLLPLCVPGPGGPVLSCQLPPPPCHSALVPGLLNWDEAHDTLRALPASQAGQRVWLHWPSEPDPATGWLLAELEVVDAGAPNGHVWLGLGPAPESLRRLRSGLSSPGGSLAPAGPSLTSVAPPASVLSPAGSVATALAPTLLRTGTTNASGVKGLPPVPLPANAAASAAAACPSTVAAAAAAPPCPVMDNPLTHVVCVRDGLAFRGGVQTASMLGVGGAAGAARMEARSGDTVSLFWNRAGRAAVFCLNGRYCGRIAGLPPAEELVPILGLKCGGFTFRWRVGGSCSAAITGGLPADTMDADADGGSPLSPTAAAAAGGKASGDGAAGQNSTDVDSMLVREQMMHEDPEAPWQCKAPSMTSLHFAAWSGNRRVLPQLIRAKGFHPDEPDADGWTALHFAALAGQVSIVAQLLLFGAKPDACSKYGYTPVWLAAKYGRSSDHVEIVRRLAEAGAGLTGRDGRGRTLLMLAAEAGNLGMVQLLLDRDLDPCATDCQDREAQQYAGQHGAIFRLLRGAVASRRGASAGARKAAKKRLAAAAAQKEAPNVATAPLLPLMAVAQPLLQDGEDEDEDGDDHGEFETEEEDEGHGGIGGSRHHGHGRRADRRHLPQLAARWRVGAGELVRGRLIEQGAFGRVFEGTWCGTRVAIKQVIPVDRRSAGGAIGGAVANGAAGDDTAVAPGHAAALAGLDQEVAILAALPPHERVARMLGSVSLPGEGLCLVMAYYPHTLQGVMQSERLRRSWLTPARRAAIARQLAEGLAFLHGLPALRVIHRDLKPNNVLLEAPPSLDVKICDFGLARLLAGADVQSSSAAGHAFWMAPELLRGLPYDEKVDVYSYGVILYQLAFWVDDQLYGGLNKAQVDFQVVHGLLRLQDRITASVAASAAGAAAAAAAAAGGGGGGAAAAAAATPDRTAGGAGTGGGAAPGTAAGPAGGTPGAAVGAAAGVAGGAGAATGGAAVPPIPVVGMDPALVALVQACVDENPKARPTMEEVVRRLAVVREMPQPQAVAMVAHRQQQQQQQAVAATGVGNEAPQPSQAEGGTLVGSPMRPSGLLGAA